MKKILILSFLILFVFVGRSFALTITMEEFFDKSSRYFTSDVLQNQEIDEESKTYLSNSITMDVSAFVQYVLRESYLLQNALLQDYAEKVQRYNEVKEKVRSALEDLRDAKQDWNEEENKYGLEILPYLLYMGSTSESTTVLVADVDDDDLSTVNSFLTSSGIQNFNFAPSDPSTPVPEPATLFLLGAGLIGLAGLCGKKFKKM